MRKAMLVGVSERTLAQSPDSIPPDVILVAISPSGEPVDRSPEVVWRRQWDRTAWVVDSLAHAHELRWIHTDTAGVDRLPLRLLDERGVRLTNARGAHTPAVTEWALGALLLLGKNMATTVLNGAVKQWVPHQEDLLLKGRTVLVLGLGDIGRSLASACSALGMRVLGVSRSGAAVPGVERVFSSGEIWQEALPNVSFLVNCLPFTPETADLVDLSVLGRMGRPGYFINVGRGETVVEADLVTAITSGVLRGAVLDAVRQEPLPGASPLWDQPRIVVSPHASSFNDATEPRTRRLFLEELERFVQGRPPLNQVDLARGY